MSDPSKRSPSDTRIPEVLTADEQAAEVSEHRRYWLGRLLQIGVLTVILGGWEGSARPGCHDPVNPWFHLRHLARSGHGEQSGARCDAHLLRCLLQRISGSP